MSGIEDGGRWERDVDAFEDLATFGKKNWGGEGRQTRPMDLAVQSEGRGKWLGGMRNIKSRPWDSVSPLAPCCV